MTAAASQLSADGYGKPCQDWALHAGDGGTTVAKTEPPPVTGSC